MVERMDDVPAGVIGLRASGKLTKEDYTDVLEPALKAAMDSGEARVVFVLTVSTASTSTPPSRTSRLGSAWSWPIARSGSGWRW
jgi:hypothetical protein